MKLWRAVRENVVKSGSELDTHAIDVIEKHTIVEALEVKNTRAGKKRIRCAEGWVSTYDKKKGVSLMVCLGEARLEKIELAKQQAVQDEQDRRDSARAQLELRGAKLRLMQLLAVKLREEAQERNAFEVANLQKLLVEKRYLYKTITTHAVMNLRSVCPVVGQQLART
jgi:hypothetical protein